jgi:hypothetical protein
MRIALCVSVFIAAFLMGCSSDHSTDDFYDRHPQYDQRPSYFDKNPNYDDQDLNDRYSGDKE